MQTVDTLIHAAWIVPVEPDDRVLDDHSLAIHEGRLVAVLPTADARRSYRATAEIELPAHALIPGLVNAHTHAAMTLLRGLADDLHLMDWLQHHVWPAEARWVNEEFVQDGTELALAEMLRGGTTCFNDMYFFPEVTARTAAAAGLRATVGLILIDFPTGYAGNADDYLAKGLALHDAYRNHPLIRTAFAPHAPYSVSDAPLARVRVLADELDIPVHMHVHETAHEVEQAMAQQGRRPLARLQELGLVSPSLLAVHMTQLTDAEIGQCAAAGVSVVHCPESNLKLASGFCPVQRLLQAGVNVALGTDGAASNNDLDMLGDAHGHAERRHRARPGRPDRLAGARQVGGRLRHPPRRRRIHPPVPSAVADRLCQRPAAGHGRLGRGRASAQGPRPDPPRRGRHPGPRPPLASPHRRGPDPKSRICHGNTRKTTGMKPPHAALPQYPADDVGCV